MTKKAQLACPPLVETDGRTIDERTIDGTAWDGSVYLLWGWGDGIGRGRWGCEISMSNSDFQHWGSL